MSIASDINKFSGCILGLALGDALGAPFEGMRRIDTESLERRLTVPDMPLKYTDDTEMAIGLSEALIEGLSTEILADRFMMNFDTSRGYGRGTVAIIEKLRNGTHWTKASRSVFPDGSYGNGAAMRVAPVGLMYHRDHISLLDAVYTSCIVTHTHPLAIEGAAIIALTTSLAVNDLSGEEILKEIRKNLREPVYIAKTDRIREFLNTPPDPFAAAMELGCSVRADESVPAALLAFLVFRNDFISAVRYAISMGGDTDSMAAMAGAMSGASAGLRALPGTHLGLLENVDLLREIAKKLHGCSERQG